jgi:predicted GH43/DUF377 family glycosyl hydrolase
MMTAQGYAIESIATLGLTYAPELEGMYTLSPFVWRDETSYRMLLRLVNRSNDPKQKVARIHAGLSNDGVTFALHNAPAIAPSPDGPDRAGCEDPTVLVDGSGLIVYYSGYDDRNEHSELLVASGPNAEALMKTAVAIPWSEAHKNPKEGELIACSDGTWALFFEYAFDGASQIGLARGPSAAGPWTIDERFRFEQRPGSWDSHHLSPGPIVMRDGVPVMFYNGSGAGAAWRIGWVSFSADFATIAERCDQPIIVPPPPAGDETDIAFVASAIDNGDTIDLYYSVADKSLKRATVRPS